MNLDKGKIVLFQTLFFSILYTSLYGQKNARINDFVVDYYATTCNITQQHLRHYINDYVYVDSFENIVDTFMVKEGKIALVKRNIPYTIADIENDTITNAIHYCYTNEKGYDTVKLKDEPELYYKLRLDQSITIFKPFKADTLDRDRVIYAYYVLGNCYPISEKCIASKIKNGQYGIMYFEKSVGVVGNAAANERCIYLINQKSYHNLLTYLNHKR